MARPLTEYIYSQVLPWQSDVGGPGRPDVTAKVLSRDADNGESSLIVRYPAGWERAKPEALTVEEEMYILDGEIVINGRTYRRDTYACFPPGYVRESAASENGCVALTFFDGVPDVAKVGQVIANKASPLVEYLDLYAMPWDTKVADPALTWMGLRRKVLRWDPVYNQKGTFVIATPPHVFPDSWLCPTLTHPCAEEAFMLAGEMTGPHGRQAPGAYFWRPADIAHGPFGTRDGSLSLIRFRHGTHVNIWDPTPIPFVFDSPYKPIIPAELSSIAKDYVGAERY